MLFSPENRISVSSMLFSPENRISISSMLFSPENRINISSMLFSPGQASSFVTSSKLEALEQRLETLVNAKLQQTMTVCLPREKLPAVDSSVNRDSPGAAASSSSARRLFTGSPGKTRSYRHESNTETSDLCATTSDDQAVLKKTETTHAIDGSDV